MKRSATVNQIRSNRLYSQSEPLLLHNRRKQKQRAFDAATEYFKKYKTPLTDTLQTFFGVQFFARAALWLDPLAEFRNVRGIYSNWNRTRNRSRLKLSGSYSVRTRNVRSQNYYEDEITEYPEYVTHDESFISEESTFVGPSYPDRCRDTTVKSRIPFSFLDDGSALSTDPPSFGELILEKFDSTTKDLGNVVFRNNTERVFLFAEDTLYPLYDKDYTQDVLALDGSCTLPSGDLLLPDIEAFALDFMNENVSGMISSAVASRREFNATYQIAELRELPRLIRDISSLRSLVERYVKNPLKFRDLDKDIASLYLSWQFGVKSTYNAIRDLMFLPERATKRLNYLIERNGKKTTSRSKRTWLKSGNDAGLPTFEFVLPPWIEVSEEDVQRTLKIELRCVINQTIQFPLLAVPSLSDGEFRRLIGLEITAEDIYNLVPFTWLIDWFGGLGAYIDVMSAIHSDKQIINYGFLTIVIHEELTHQAKLKVSSRQFDWYSLDGEPQTISDTSTVSEFPYLKKYHRKYQHRVSIGDLEGVKSFGFSFGNLNEFQTSILGALISQRAK